MLGAQCKEATLGWLLFWGTGRPVYFWKLAIN